SMRTERILFLRSLGEPADQVADIGRGSPIFLGRDVVDHLLMRRRAMRRRSVRKIVLFGEDLDARSLAVDVDPISEVEATAALSGSGLFEVTSDFREIDR